MTIFIPVFERHYRDRDNYPRTEIEFDEDLGYYTDRAAADVALTTLNQAIREQFEKGEAQRKTQHAVRVRDYEQRGTEIQALRDAGIARPSIPALPKPAPFEARPFDLDETSQWVLVEVGPAKTGD